MKRPLVLGASLLLACAASAASSPVADLLNRFVASNRVAGVVSVLAEADGRETYDCAGWADRENRRPMTPDTLFAIFSMTKTVTGAALMCAIDEGKIALDDPAAKYVPAFAAIRMKDGTAPKRPVTIRDLMSHVSGTRCSVEIVKRAVPIREVAEICAKTPLVAQPGETFAYNNVGIDTAAACLEVAVGESYACYLQRKILDPLGMVDTTFWPDADQLKRLVRAYTTDDKPLRPAADNCAKQLVFETRAVKPVKVYAAPSAGLFSTPRDMVRFSRLLAHHGVWEGKTIISRATFDRVFAVVQTPPALKKSYTCGSWLYGDWFGHEGAMRTDQRANLRTGQSRVFFIETENKAGSAFFELKAAWHAACDCVQKTPPTVFGN